MKDDRSSQRCSRAAPYRAFQFFSPQDACKTHLLQAWRTVVFSTDRELQSGVVERYATEEPGNTNKAYQEMAKLQAKPAARRSATAQPPTKGQCAGKKDPRPRLEAFKMQRPWTANPPATVSESAAAPAIRTDENTKDKAAEGAQLAPVPHACLNSRPGREAVAFQRQDFANRRAQSIISQSAAAPAGGTYQVDFQRLRAASSCVSSAGPAQVAVDSGQKTEQVTEKAEPADAGRRSTSSELGSGWSRCRSQTSTGVLIEEEDKESSVDSDVVDLLVA